MSQFPLFSKEIKLIFQKYCQNIVPFLTAMTQKVFQDIKKILFFIYANTLKKSTTVTILVKELRAQKNIWPTAMVNNHMTMKNLSVQYILKVNHQRLSSTQRVQQPNVRLRVTPLIIWNIFLMKEGEIF